MSPQVHDGKQTLFFRYGMAVLLTLLVFAIRLMFDPVLGLRLSFLPFALAVMISAAVGGAGPGFLSTFLGMVTATYFWQEPRFEFSIENRRQLVEMLMFFAVATGINLFAVAMKVRSGKRRTLTPPRINSWQCSVMNCEHR